MSRIYSGTGVWAGHAHWQSTTLWKYSGSVMLVGCNLVLLCGSPSDSAPGFFVISILRLEAETRMDGRVQQRSPPGSALHITRVSLGGCVPAGPFSTIVHMRRSRHAGRPERDERPD